jgi:putative iron-only hydrogenase system regulator
MEKRLGVVSIIVEDMGKVSSINDILHNYSHTIVGRMGIPYRERGVSVISLIVDGTTDEIGSITGKLGILSGVQVKSVLSKNNQAV